MNDARILDAANESCDRQSHYTFTVYPDASYFSEVIELWTEFALSMAHIDGFNGLATIMPVTPRAIAEGVRRGGNALAVDQAKPNTTLSGTLAKTSIELHTY